MSLTNWNMTEPSMPSTVENEDKFSIPSFPGQSQQLVFADGSRQRALVRIRANATWPHDFDKKMEAAGWYRLNERGPFLRQYVRTWNAPQ